MLSTSGIVLELALTSEARTLSEDPYAVSTTQMVFERSGFGEVGWLHSKHDHSRLWTVISSWIQISASSKVLASQSSYVQKYALRSLEICCL